MGAQGEVFTPSYHTWQNPKVPSFTCTMGFFAKSFLWFGVSLASANPAADARSDWFRDKMEAEASGCGEKLNHYGGPWTTHPNVASSCDCAEKCNQTVTCKAWTYSWNIPYKSACYLRENYGYALTGGTGFLVGSPTTHARSGEAPTCGRFENHNGSPWDVVADVERSCDCAKKCTDSHWCKAWTHDGSKTCFLRKSAAGGFTVAHYAYGMTSDVIESRLCQDARFC